MPSIHDVVNQLFVTLLARAVGALLLYTKARPGGAATPKYLLGRSRSYVAEPHKGALELGVGLWLRRGFLLGGCFITSVDIH